MDGESQIQIVGHHSFREGDRGKYTVKITLMSPDDLTEDQVNTLVGQIRERITCLEVSCYPPRNRIGGPGKWLINIVEPTSIGHDDGEAWTELCAEVGITLP